MGQQPPQKQQSTYDDDDDDNEYAEIIQDSKFYILKIPNDKKPIVFSDNYVNGRHPEFVSISVPLFDNICTQFDTNTVIINGNTYILKNGLYMSGIDIVSVLNDLTSTTENVNWSYNSIIKRFTVSSSSIFTLDSTRLSSLMLGFSGENTGQESYSANQICNFFPFSAILINSNKFPRKINYLNEFGTDDTASFMFTIDTFDFVSKTTLVIDKQSFYAHQLFSDSVIPLFPIIIELKVLFTDGSSKVIPLSSTNTAELVIKMN